MLGAVQVETVGALSSGRLVFVASVTPHKAVLVSLPEQRPGEFNDPGRTLLKPFVTTPFVTVEPVDTEELSELNRKFVENLRRDRDH